MIRLYWLIMCSLYLVGCSSPVSINVYNRGAETVETVTCAQKIKGNEDIVLLVTSGRSEPVVSAETDIVVGDEVVIQAYDVNGKNFHIFTYAKKKK